MKKISSNYHGNLLKDAFASVDKNFPLIVETASALSDEHQQRLENLFRQKYGLSGGVMYHVNPALLAGIRLSIGDLVIENNVLSQIENLRSELTDYSVLPDYPNESLIAGVTDKWATKLEDRLLSDAKADKAPSGGETEVPDDGGLDKVIAIAAAQNTEYLFDNMQKTVASFEPRLTLQQEGVVLAVSDGVAFVGGLSSCMLNEMLVFDDNVFGLAMSLEKDRIGVILFGDYAGVEEGDIVCRTGNLLSVGASKEMLGRVVNALGLPLDEKGELTDTVAMPVEAEAPEIVARASVKKPMMTGIVAIDAMVPIGCGQRELIIGDRQTGKSTIAIDTIINQKNQGVICIYVAIGQKASSIRATKELLEENGALDYTIIVSASAGEPSAMQYIAPFAGCAIAEHFMREGLDVLIVFDDLSKQAVAYRELSLLLRRPAGREAYPGDIFYLHSRLLERSAQLNESSNNGSLTALPIVETQFGNVASAIPTNVISITDGQIFLEADLFRSGQRPAVNVGISVSRVGGSAQTRAMKKVAGRLRIDLAQFRELEAFSQFSQDMDQVTKDKLARGTAITELLRQPPHHPFSLEEQVLIIYAGTHGFFDRVPKPQIFEVRGELLDFFKTGMAAKCLHDIRRTTELDEETEKLLAENISLFFKQRLKAESAPEE